jgi:HSP20 family protein
MAKKQKKQTSDVDVAERDASDSARSFGPIGLDEWFDRWPEVFARRWPESFRGFPMFDDAFRLEQFTEDDGTFVLRAELPGIDPDDGLEVTVDDGRLVITARREERSEDREKGAYRSEFRYGSFHRSIRLPAGADEDAIDATFTQGILEIRVPCDDEASSARTIPIASKE